MNKKEIRSFIKNKRNALTKEDVKDKSKLIVDSLLKTHAYKNANTIFSFISFGSEVETHELIRKMLEDKKTVGVPYTKSNSRDMIVSKIDDFDRDLEEGFYNILSPRKDELRPIEPKDIDLVLVPGLAFDEKGYRVGYGGGYYDTFFEKAGDNPIKIGLCFDLQIIDSCPIGIYDVAVDYIITESKIIKIK